MKYKFNFTKVAIYMVENKVGKQEFCKRAGIPLNTLKKLREGNCEIKLKTMVKLALFLNTTLEKLFDIIEE